MHLRVRKSAAAFLAIRKAAGHRGGRLTREQSAGKMLVPSFDAALAHARSGGGAGYVCTSSGVSLAVAHEQPAISFCRCHGARRNAWRDSGLSFATLNGDAGDLQ